MPNETASCLIPEVTPPQNSIKTTLMCIDGILADDLETIDLVRWWSDGVFHIMICIAGFIANLISIRVLLSKDMQSLFNKTLAMLAFCDAVFILCDTSE